MVPRTPAVRDLRAASPRGSMKPCDHSRGSPSQRTPLVLLRDFLAIDSKLALHLNSATIPYSRQPSPKQFRSRGVPARRTRWSSSIRIRVARRPAVEIAQAALPHSIERSTRDRASVARDNSRISRDARPSASTLAVVPIRVSQLRHRSCRFVAPDAVTHSRSRIQRPGSCGERPINCATRGLLIVHFGRMSSAALRAIGRSLRAKILSRRTVFQKGGMRGKLPAMTAAIAIRSRSRDRLSPTKPAIRSRWLSARIDFDPLISAGRVDCPGLPRHLMTRSDAAIEGFELGSRDVTFEWAALRGRGLDSQGTSCEFLAVHRPQRERGVVLIRHLDKSEPARAPVETVTHDLGSFDCRRSRQTLRANRHRPAKNSGSPRRVSLPSSHHLARVVTSRIAL